MVVYQFAQKLRAKEFARKKNERTRKYQYVYQKFNKTWIVAKFPKGSHGRAVLRRLSA